MTVLTLLPGGPASGWISTTEFPDVHATRFAGQRDLPWSAFVQGLQDLPPSPKNKAPLIKLARFSGQRTPNRCLRDDAYVLALFGIEGDYDAGEIAPEEALGRLERHNLRACIVTTHSHTPTAPRWRVFAPLSRVHPPCDHARLVARLNGALDGILASESFNLSQSYYIGPPPGGEYTVLHTFGDVEEGYFLDEADELDVFAEGPAKPKQEGPSVGKLNADLCAAKAKGLKLSHLGAGKWSVTCPWEAEHTTPANGSDTAYFEPHTNGFAGAGFRCLHGHCTGRDIGDFRRAVGIGAGPAADAPQPDATLLLPSNPPELARLPHGLGVLQDYVHGRMLYPCPHTAGVIAFALVTTTAQRNVTVASFAGLGLNEYFVVLAPTSRGKEDLRGPFPALHEALRKEVLEVAYLPAIHHAMPASQQALHQLLEQDPSALVLADEFAEWLAHTSTDPHKQAALGHAMQAYNRALGTLAAPHAVTREYQPVKHPRLSILATSTPERLLEAANRGHADSGAYNRLFLFAADLERIPKRYEGQRYTPSEAEVSVLRWIGNLPPTRMDFAPDAWRFFCEHDAEVIEPLKFDDPHLAGRLSEQAIKMAAAVALSDRRITIEADDLRIAFAIREGIYQRVRALATHDGSLDGLHASGAALKQVQKLFERHPELYLSRLSTLSRRYAALSVQEQTVVIRALESAGICERQAERKGLLVSLVCGK